ncbi:PLASMODESMATA CALLOSE-BINDING PROTEIN 2-like [Carex rostrata]
MAALVLLLSLLFSVGGSDAIWCVCRSDQSTPNLQKTIDYACGAGADCTPTKQGGVCSSPDTVLSHCSYVANSYFQKNGQAQTACNFSGTATISTTDPSYNSCSYPSTASAAGTSTTPSSTTPSSPMTGTTTPTSFTPTGTTTTGGVLGGMGPTGTTSFDGSGTDPSHLPETQLVLVLFSILFSLVLSGV